MDVARVVGRARQVVSVLASPALRERAPGRQWFEVDVPAGERSKWLTLMGTRVLRWWDGAATAG
ncbi:hypothetical protein [Curtobacterium flaccumfaciens]|uniref:hypothetical protein n=1 Tax=Curtobacterium flaccumfaciens TaxID=2035 RepID=UPI0035B25055